MKSIAAAVVALLATGGALASEALANKSGCLACHTTDRKIVGPAYREVFERYKGVKGAEDQLVDAISQGGSGKWGDVPMPPKGNNPKLSDKDIKTLARWILDGAR